MVRRGFAKRAGVSLRNGAQHDGLIVACGIGPDSTIHCKGEMG